MSFTAGKYVVGAHTITIPAGTQSPSTYLFNSQQAILVNSNHTEQVVRIESEDKQEVKMKYVEVREGIRKNHAGKTIFPIVDNAKDILKPRRFLSCDWEWLVAVQNDGKGPKTYFLGDTPKFDISPDNAKFVLLARVKTRSEEGIETILCIIVDDMKEKKEIEDLIRYGNELRFKVKGMDAWVKKGSTKMQRYFIVSEFEVIEESYEDIIPTLQRISHVNHMSIWKDLGSDKVIPSFVESNILMSALFFFYEGFAAINLIMLGKPGTGKSFFLDVVAYVIGTNNHNCMETTLKGLVFSHAEKGGVYGVLYRERFVALLNEFMRIVSSARREATKDDVRRLLSTLNDAVEKKRNRSRSSGLVEGAEATMICSMITSDNYYPSVVSSFVDAMLDDPSYMRRYAFLKLSEETQERGRNFTRVPDWREDTDRLLKYRGLGFGKWYKLLRFWRSQVKEAMKSIEMKPFIEYARRCMESHLKNMFFKEGEQRSLNTSTETEDLYLMASEADFSQLAIACACSAAIMGSTFRNQELKLPRVEMHVEDEAVAYAMIKRLIGDMMALIEPGVAKKLAGGIQRSGRW